jgi:DNA-binding transcriptional LysR family regulator
MRRSRQVPWAAMANARKRQRRLELHLVPTLDALLTERSVTRAAAKLGVTQSAVSHGLRKLRDHFGDELLVRSPQGFVLTSRAERLADAVRRSLELLEQADEDAPFEPGEARRSFTIVMADFVALVLLTPLLERVEKEAPNVEIVVRHLTAESERALETGAVDLLIANSRSTPAGCFRQKLAEDSWVTLLREGHPTLRGGTSIDLARFIAMRHVLVAPRGTGRGPVDEALEAVGETRRIAVRVPQLSLAAFIVARTDLVTTAIASAARAAAKNLPITLVEPPLDLPRQTWVQLWHERSQRDSGHAWLRRVLAEVALRARE